VGLLIPEDIPLDRLPSSERRVVRAFQSALKDSWLIVPRLGVAAGRRPYEVDVLLINGRQGIVGVEVKGGPFKIRDGEWYRRGEIVEPSPPRQAQDAAYALRDRLRERSPALPHVHVQHAVALPDLAELEGDLPLELTRDHLLLMGDVADPEDRLYDLMVGNYQNGPLDDDQIEAVIEIVRPDVDFRWDPQAQARQARVTLHRITADQTRALATLDMNRRVVVSGPAGCGKSRLVLAWAYRALRRGERTLLTCFNEPMAQSLREDVPEHDLLSVGSVQRTLMDLEELPPLEIPPGAGEQWWRDEPFRHVENHLDSVVDRFDTILIDEAQDFAPHWLEVLEHLLGDGGQGKILMVADPDQAVFDRGFVMPDSDSGVVRAELTMNCRNTHEIARFLRPLGGSPAAPGAPEGEPVELVACQPEHVVAKTGELLEDLVVSSQIDPSNILVLTGHTALRDRIREESPGGFACTTWEDRHRGDIVCETIHRMKGLERDAVILVTTDDHLEDHLLYVGMSRAVSRLVVVGPSVLMARLQTGRGQNQESGTKLGSLP